MKKTIEVVAAVIKAKHKYFCAQRGNQGEQAQKWEFPGGKIEIGESKQEALKREILEELDTAIEVIDYIMTVNHEYKEFKLTMHAYTCKVIRGELNLSEHLNFRWATIKEMKSMDFAEADIPIITKLESIECKL